MIKHTFVRIVGLFLIFFAMMISKTVAVSGWFYTLHDFDGYNYNV